MLSRSTAAGGSIVLRHVGGIVLQGGALTVDLGYRYKKILAGGVASALSGGNDFQVNQVRLGVDVRF